MSNLREQIEAREKPFWEPIGRYVFQFGMLEHKVDEELSTLMGLNYYGGGDFVLNEIDLSARLQLFKAYCRDCDASLQGEMKAIITELEGQNTFRNNLLHGPWMAYLVENGEATAQKMGLSRSHKAKVFSVTAQEIADRALLVRGLLEHLVRLCRKIAEARAARRS